MNIRTRLALQFLVLASLILVVAFVALYLRASEFREEEFMGRLRDTGAKAAKLLVEVGEMDDLILRRIERNNTVRLPDEAITVFDSNDRVLLHLGSDHSNMPIAPALLDSIRRFQVVTRAFGQHELYGAMYTERADRFVVITSGLDVYGRSKLRDLAKVMMLTMLVGPVLIFMIGRSFARRALSPVQRLVEDLQRIGASDLSNRIRMDNETDELAQLAATFNALLARLQAAFLAQKNFISNASHEMRTPLTAITGQIDVLLLKPRAPEQYTAALRSLQEDLRAVNRLSDRLLMIAQAETEATTGTFVPVRMDELLWSARTEVIRGDVDNQVVVTIEGVEDGSDVTVNGNEILLRSMLVNLMENACKYSPNQIANVTLKGSGTHVRLLVADTGIGIAPEDHERIFEHFYRIQNKGGAKGHGVGLSIVKRIVELHAGAISVRSSLGAGAEFTVELPKAA